MFSRSQECRIISKFISRSCSERSIEGLIGCWDRLYGFWLEGSEIDKNAGHANLTSWFMVNKKGYGEARDLKA